MNYSNKSKIFNNNIHVWCININKTLFEYSLKYINLLSNQEKEKFYSFKFNDDRARLLVSHIAFRSIINHYVNIPLNHIKLKYNGYDKPYIANELDHPLYFNLSHSGNKALIAFNDSEIGIDIEYINKQLEIEEIASIILSNQELDDFLELNFTNDRLHYFFTIWTKKEAYLKALSVGLIDNLGKINVNSNTKSTLFSIIPGNNRKYFIEKININDPDYMVAASYTGEDFKNITLFQWAGYRYNP